MNCQYSDLFLTKLWELAPSHLVGFPSTMDAVCACAPSGVVLQPFVELRLTGGLQLQADIR
jgi:hypothetical protein